MAGRKPKLTDNPSDRADQRRRTEQLVEETKEMAPLQPTPPRHLKGVARYTWLKIAPILNETQWIKQADKATVELFCINYQLMRDAYKDILENGQVSKIYRTVVNPVTGKVISKDFMGIKRNPSTQILDAATTKVKVLAESLGLTPASRAQLLAIMPKEETDEPSLQDILGQESDF